MRDLKRFEEDIQNILDKFQFEGETRRKIFSQLVRAFGEQQAGKTQKGSQNE